MKPEEMLAQIDGVIANVRERLDSLVEARRLIANAYTLPIAINEAPVVSKPREVARHTKSTQSIGSHDENTTRVLVWLRRQKAPVTVTELTEGVGLSWYFVKKALSSLESAGEVERTGKASATKLGVPAVMAAAAKEDL